MKVTLVFVLIFFSFAGYAQVTSGLKFDSIETNFKYAATTRNLDYYAENGKADVHNNLASAYQIGVFDKIPDAELKTLAAKLVHDYERDGFKFLDKSVTETEISGYKAFVIESKIKNKSRIGITYQAMLIGEKAYVFFRGVAYKDLDKYLTKYKNTVASVEVP